MTSENESQKVYVDIRTLPVPPGHAPLEYDEDGTLFFAWDTNALDHSHWEFDDFEKAVMASVQEFGAPKSLGDVTIVVAARRAQVYNAWLAKGGWEPRVEPEVPQAADEPAPIEEPPNPLLEPIQGVTLREYAQVQIKQSEGVELNAILAALGIDPAVWAEAHPGWLGRMSADDTAVVNGEFGRLYQDGVDDPRLLAIGDDMPSTNQENLQRLRTDHTFAVELSAARSAAYGAGLDGDAWIASNFGISPSDFRPVWGKQSLLAPEAEMEGDTEKWRQLSLRAVAGDQAAREYVRENMLGAVNWSALQSAFYDAYVRRFTAEMGGGIADDITF